MKVFDQSAIQSTEHSFVRELSLDELESVTGAGTSSNLYSSNYQGGSDGYGGSRRNP